MEVVTAAAAVDGASFFALAAAANEWRWNVMSSAAKSWVRRSIMGDVFGAVIAMDRTGLFEFELLLLLLFVN